MRHIELEQELRKRIKKRRIIEAMISLGFFIISIVFMIAYEQSKVVEELDWGFIKHQSVTYNYNWAWGILIGWLGFTPAMIALCVDLIYSKVATIEVNNDYITLYRGTAHINVYVNGEYKNGLFLFGYYLDAPLSDGTKVNVALGKWSAHLTFSNGHPPVDIF